MGISVAQVERRNSDGVGDGPGNLAFDYYSANNLFV